MDNHADTHYFGRNIRPISFTSEEFAVAPFLAEYYEQVNIPICTGATLYTMNHGSSQCLYLAKVYGLATGWIKL